MAGPLHDIHQVNVDRLDRLVEPSPAATLSRSLLATPGFRQTLFGMDAGQELSEHTSSFLAIVQVISGILRVTVPGRELEMQRDTWLTLPPDTPHAVRAIEPARFLLTLVRVE